MRISDWSSDVCSSDLICRTHRPAHGTMADPADDPGRPLPDPDSQRPRGTERGSKWERPCRLTRSHTSELQSLMRISYAVFCLKKKKKKIQKNKNKKRTSTYKEFTHNDHNMPINTIKQLNIYTRSHCKTLGIISPTQ